MTVVFAHRTKWENCDGQWSPGAHDVAIGRCGLQSVGADFTSYSVKMYRFRYVLEYPRPDVVKNVRRVPPDLIEQSAADVDFIRLRSGLDACCKIYTVSDKVISLDDDISDMEPESHPDGFRTGFAKAA